MALEYAFRDVRWLEVVVPGFPEGALLIDIFEREFRDVRVGDEIVKAFGLNDAGNFVKKGFMPLGFEAFAEEERSVSHTDLL